MSDRILIVEDEEKIARFLELELSHEGYSVTKRADGRSGLEQAESGNHDLVLLDIMLPELNGLEVLRRLRRTSSIPVILLTARDAVSEKVTGLDLGADDYITKPFAIEELLARIRMALRHSPNHDSGAEELRCGLLRLSPDRHQVKYGDELIDLTAREFTLLEVLLRNRNIVLSRPTLMEKVWGTDFMGETNVVDVYIRYLRSKLDDAYQTRIIHTVRGVGYVIKDAE